MTSYHTKKRIMVTGGAGFIGSHLCDRLVSQGFEVICVDNLFSGTKENIRHQFTNQNFEFIRHDIISPIRIDVDEIYNLASPASPPQYQRDPLQTIRSNLFGSINVLGICRRVDGKVLQASTSEVYGDPEIHPQPETYWGNVNPIGMRSCYDESKRCAETIFYEYHKAYGTRIKIARIFNTYGPRMHINDGRVISNFIVRSLRNEEITIYGDGSQTRSFCYVDDMVDGLIDLMGSSDSITGPINLGGTVEIDIYSLANLIKDLVGSKSTIREIAMPSDDPRRRKPDLSLAKESIGWNPGVDLITGLKNTIFDVDKRLKN